jgi:hydrogenase expression/formation protein HypC
MKVVSITGPLAQVEEAGVRRQVRVDLIEELAVGDYVIVHAGVAIDRVDPVEAEGTRRLIAELLGGGKPGSAGVGTPALQDGDAER